MKNNPLYNFIYKSKLIIIISLKLREFYYLIVLSIRFRIQFY